jgi:hypothetical protein
MGNERMAKNIRASGKLSDLKQSLRKMRTYDDRQFLALATFATRNLTREWFANLCAPPPDTIMSMLLLHVYAASKAGSPLHKKAVWKQIGLEDIKKGRKYVALAEEAGWIEIASSPDDQRRDLLLSTDTLNEVAEIELHNFGNELLQVTRDLFPTEFPLDDSVIEITLGVPNFGNLKGPVKITTFSARRTSREVGNMVLPKRKRELSPTRAKRSISFTSR